MPDITGNTRDENGRWLPGVSGNPEGKPPGALSFIAYWQRRWREDPKEFEKLAELIVNDEKLRGLILQMIDGRPRTPLEFSGNPDLPLSLNINVRKDD